MLAPTLSARALGRALAARQLLAERAQMSALEAVEHLVGLQSQATRPPYFGLWTRLAGFRAEELSALLRDRKAVRVNVMRGTVHLVSAADCLQLRAITKGLYERLVRSNYGRQLGGVDPQEVADAAYALLREGPRTAQELAAALGERWPGHDTSALAMTARSLCDVVQIPPRGLWGASGQPTYSTVESWLGRPVPAEPDVASVVLRYLGAFGPASVMDAQTWSGLTRLAEVFERLRPQLRTFRSESGRELFDLPEAPRPDPALPLPVRFLAEYDNVLLSHADRSRIISDGTRAAIATPNGQVPGTVLVDGSVRGVWRVRQPRARTAELAVTPLGAPFGGDEERALAAEGERLLRFAVHGGEESEAEAAAEELSVSFAAPKPLK